MNKFNLCLLILLSLVVTSCTRNLDGKYIVYKIIEDNHHEFGPYGGYINDTIYTFLKTQLQSKKYSIKFKKDFAKLTTLSNNEDMVLAKEIGQDGNPYYIQETKQGVAECKFVLLPKQDSLLLGVTMRVPADQPLIQPVQLGGLDTRYKINRVVCYLSKIE